MAIPMTSKDRTAQVRQMADELEKLARVIAADFKHRDNDLPTVIGRIEKLLAGVRVLAGEQADDTDIVNRVTAVVREADRDFETGGGSSRHWVRDWFLPTLNRAGLSVIVTASRNELLAALTGVVRVADRNTAEFDTARAAIAKAEVGYEGVAARARAAVNGGQDVGECA